MQLFALTLSFADRAEYARRVAAVQTPAPGRKRVTAVEGWAGFPGGDGEFLTGIGPVPLHHFFTAWGVGVQKAAESPPRPLPAPWLRPLCVSAIYRAVSCRWGQGSIAKVVLRPTQRPQRAPPTVHHRCLGRALGTLLPAPTRPVHSQSGARTFPAGSLKWRSVGSKPGCSPYILQRGTPSILTLRPPAPATQTFVIPTVLAFTTTSQTRWPAGSGRRA